MINADLPAEDLESTKLQTDKMAQYFQKIATENVDSSFELRRLRKGLPHFQLIVTEQTALVLQFMFSRGTADSLFCNFHLALNYIRRFARNSKNCGNQTVEALRSTANFSAHSDAFTGPAGALQARQILTRAGDDIWQPSKTSMAPGEGCGDAGPRAQDLSGRLKVAERLLLALSGRWRVQRPEHAFNSHNLAALRNRRTPAQETPQMRWSFDLRDKVRLLARTRS